MKKQYTRPTIEKEEFVLNNVITASSTFSEEFNNPNDENVPWEDLA